MKLSYRGVRRVVVVPFLVSALASGCAASGTTPAASGNTWVVPSPPGSTAPATPAVAPSAASATAVATRTPTRSLPASASPAPVAKGTPAPLFPPGYTAVSQTCALQRGEREYVSRSGKTKGYFGFCTQLLRKNDTGRYHLNPYVFVEPWYFYGGQWLRDAREPVTLTITCRISRKGEQDYSLTGVSPSGNGPMHTASCGRLVPHAVTATTDSDPYTVRFTGYTSGGFYGPLAADCEVHFPGVGKPAPEQLVRVPG